MKGMTWSAGKRGQDKNKPLEPYNAKGLMSEMSLTWQTRRSRNVMNDLRVTMERRQFIDPRTVPRRA